MREVSRSALIARPAAVVYDLINDVERYPSFVPGCYGARVLARSNDALIATLDIKKGPLRLEFTTRNRLRPPHHIDMQLEAGPFDELTGGWQLTELSDQACRASLSLRFALSNPMTALVLEPLFEGILADLVSAFVLRARQLPGDQPAAQR